MLIKLSATDRRALGINSPSNFVPGQRPPLVQDIILPLQLQVEKQSDYSIQLPWRTGGSTMAGQGLDPTTVPITMRLLSSTQTATILRLCASPTRELYVALARYEVIRGFAVTQIG
ncbi:hypothetical protein AS026_38095 [Rhizobium altiplani]|uniref:Uncharacterized protein n=1 Tax=Rhizobium altiplani TaxID=1864509 RepID=A0A109JTD3_9HYPH|nr:hypothetical protein AS026_38095 [Rhizobium altiplani]